MFGLRNITILLLKGLLAIVVISIIAWLVLPIHIFITLAVYPGMVLLPITNFIVPSRFIYWLFPEGGPEEAMISISSVAALLFWWLIAAIVIHLSKRIRSKRRVSP
jgi:hypothetical protein